MLVHILGTEDKKPVWKNVTCFLSTSKIEQHVCYKMKTIFMSVIWNIN